MSHSNPVLLKIVQQGVRYTKTERFIYKFFLENTEYILTHSITDIAKIIGASEAAITRFAKKAGYKGFNEMRLLFTHGHRFVEKEKKVSPLNSLLSDYTTHLQDAAFSVNEKLIDELISRLEQGRCVKFYATGFLGEIAENYSFRLTKLGFDVAAYTDNSKISVDAILTKKGDMVLAADFTGDSSSLTFALESARGKGAYTAAITHFSDSPLAQKADTVQLLPSTDLLPAGNLISPHTAVLFLADYYYSRILMRDLSKYSQIDECIRQGLGFPNRIQKTLRLGTE